MENEMIKLIIDHREIVVPKGTTVYQAAQQLKIDIPIFCYQDRMPPFGACRMCLVEVEKMEKPQTSCTLIAAEGMVVKTQSRLADESRQHILELLLINHPLDCPVCDRAGECPLQDHTMKYGPGLSRFYEKKRHFQKPYALGPLVMLDRERCISCARCTRFTEIISGDHSLQFIDRGYKTEVGTSDGKAPQSKFIGNTIYICPVGALTSEVYRFRARPWDNTTTSSACTLCPVGCSLYFDARDGELTRTRPREDRSLNDCWLCDKGWFGYEFSNHQQRLHSPLIRKNGKLVEASWEEALTLVANRLSADGSSGRIAGLGGNPLTIEENGLFQKLLRHHSKTACLDHRIGMPIFSAQEEVYSGGMEIQIGDCAELSFAVVMGCDLIEEFPLIWLRLKQAIDKGAKVLYFGHYRPEFSQWLTQLIIHPPGEEIDALFQHAALIESILKIKGKGALFIGSHYLSGENRSSIVKTLIDYKNKIPALTINFLEGRGNSYGARWAGVYPEKGCLSVIEMMEEAALNGWDYLHVAGSDPATKFPPDLWQKVCSQLKFLVVQDLFLTATASQADVVLPTLCYVEKEGHFLTIDRRFQKLNPSKEKPPHVLSDGEIFQTIANKQGWQLDWNETLAPPQYSLIADFSTQKLMPVIGLRALFKRELFDRANRMKHNPHLLKMVNDPRVRLHPLQAKAHSLIENDWIELKSIHGKIIAQITIDNRVDLETIILPLGYPSLPVQTLSPSLRNGISLEITKEQG